jgi:hypothetical protein
MRRWLVLSLLVVACDKPKPLPEAILGDWETLCYTDKDTASCLSKDEHGLRKTFKPGGVLEVRRAKDDLATSDVSTWALAGDELTITTSGGGTKLVDTWRARVEEERLVLWDPDHQRGQVLGRAGASFKPADSPTAKGGTQQITLNGQTFSIELPGGYRQTRNDKYKQHWGPTSGEGLTVQLSVTPRAQREEGGTFVTPPCNGYDYGGVSGSSQLVDGVERETSIGLSLCLEGTELALSCRAGHTRGYLEPSEKEAALALCKTVRP